MNKATGFLDVNDHVRLMLDAAPFCCHLWSREGKMIDCNEVNIRFFKLRNKQELLDNFFLFSPEYQPDGRRTADLSSVYLNKAFDEGQCVFEWMHQASDGSPRPAEITLVRVRYGKDDILAAYTRDLREHKRMMQEIMQRDSLLEAVNRAAAILIRSGNDTFESELQRCMGIIAAVGDFNIVAIWKNHVREGDLCCTRLHYWSDDLADRKKVSGNLVYDRDLAGWKEILSQGNCINSLVRDLSPASRDLLSSSGILSVFAAPVFWQDQFWGMVAYANYRSERLFSDNEQSILRTSTMIIFNALLNNSMAQNLSATAAKLEAIISNYSGVIWSVDQNEVITLYKGAYLEKVGKKSSDIEGLKLDAYFNQSADADLVATIRKTFTEGAQDWVTDIKGTTYHVRATPISDGSNRATGVMGSFDDITELSWLQTELQNALKAAQEANRAKDTFLAKMSHEMRTPLNAVIGLSELLLENKEINECCSLDIEKICNAGTTLLNLVNDLLDISKIEAGKFELVPAQYDIPSLLNDAITQSILYIGEKPVRFILDIDAALPLRLYGDALRVKQILNNLLSNAFKYTGEGVVELAVQCDRDGDTV